MSKFIDLNIGLPAVLNKIKTWVNSQLSGKQDTLTAGSGITIDGDTISAEGESYTFDPTPTSGSTNPVTSGGVYNAVQNMVITTVPAGSVAVINNTTTGGSSNALSAEMGKVARCNIEAVQANLQLLYNALANIAFTGDKTDLSFTALDWNGTKYAVTFNIPANMEITRNGVAVTSPLQIEEGTELELLISPASGYTISSLSADNGTLSSNGNGTYTLTITVSAAVTITFTGFTGSAVAAYPITYNLTNVVNDTRPASIVSGGSVQIPLAPESGYALSQADIVVTGATVDSYTTNVLTISNPTGDVTVTAAAYDASNIMYNGVWYEQIGSGKGFLHVGENENYLVSPLIDLGADRSESVTVKFDTNGSTSSVYGLRLFDSNGEYLNYYGQTSAAREVSINTTFRYIRLQTGNTAQILATSYIQVDGTDAWNGADCDLADAGSASDFLASSYCPQPNANGDYEGWLICAPNVAMTYEFGSGNNTNLNTNARFGTDAKKAAHSMVTAIGAATALPWVLGKLVSLPDDGNTDFSSAEIQESGTALPTLLIYGDGVYSFYGMESAAAGTDSTTRVRNRTISTTYTQARMICSQSAYDSPSPYAVFIRDATTSEVIWGDDSTLNV